MNKPKPVFLKRYGVVLQHDGYAGEHCINTVATREDGSTFEYMTVSHPSFVKAKNGPFFTGHTEWVAGGTSYPSFDEMMDKAFGIVPDADGSKPFPWMCGECGQTEVRPRKSTMSVGDVVVSDIDVPTCDNCDTQWIDCVTDDEFTKRANDEIGKSA